VRTRPLARDECGLLALVDRREQIRAEYRLVDGRLVRHAVAIDVAGWHPDELAHLVDRLGRAIAGGGFVLGAWETETIVGIASIDVAPVGGDPAVAKLDILHVSHDHRGRGVGAGLTAACADRARQLGFGSLYVSATPTCNTVDAYLAMGAVVTPTPDPELLRLEPLDIHLVLPIRE
jgi:predicted N-acetyltransferase YhbS